MEDNLSEIPNFLSRANDESPPILTAVSRLQPLKLPPPPELLIFCPQAALLRHAVKRWRGRRVTGFFGEVYLLGKMKNRVAVAGQFGVGAPVVGVLVEEFAAWGVAKFVLLGVAGGLQPSLACGDLLLADTAVRDEGTSHHYLPPAPTVAASAALTDWLATAFRVTNLPLTRGSTWTTDAPYRETAVAVAHYQQQNVQTVEMEAAALFAVAQYCQTQAAALLAVSDSLANGRWQPAANSKLPERQLAQALDVILESVL
ncbi:MAG: nucleoside phosphorylase [Anaerolineales bacterium]|nr:nucleoside phosphorylase [Anaerolineales bacterium]MCB8940138.1 nucleoside phosphorylase [Ardenticatenaceae bacterium]